MDYETVKHVEGFVENIIFRNEDNGYTVFNIIYKNEDITCVGVLGYISAGEFIVAEGNFVKHPSYYMQFTITSYEFKAPSDENSVKRYLSSGAIKGIGEKMSENIVNKFGDDTFRIMEEEPERLAEIKGISIKKAMEIAEQLNDKKELRSAMMFMQKYGISMKMANKIYSKYNSDIYKILKENPYKLADDIDGIGFKIADEIAAKVGIRADSDFRIKSGIYYCLYQAVAQGHVYLPIEELFTQVKSLLLIEMPNFDDCLIDMAIDNRVVIKKIQDKQCVYVARYYHMETGVAKLLKDCDIEYDCPDKEIDERISQIEHLLEINLDDIQKTAVKTAVHNGLMVMTGGPGTGKTTTINAIIEYFQMEGMDIRLAAPTGRAAKRMTETCGYEAQTIHRLLEVSGKTVGELTAKTHFERNEDNPLETDVIIVDEMSMVDISLMNSLLKAVAVGTRLILVGDTDQLPSVGAGNVLKDIIASKAFPVVKLEKIFRQAAESEIVTHAHEINKGKKVVLNKYSKDFLFIHRKTPEEIINAMYTLIKEKLPKYIGVDVGELQILTPSRKSSVGVERLNQLMQERLNPPCPSKMERKVKDTIFRENDKVIQTKNNYQLQWEKRNKNNIVYDTGSGVFNGDTGIIQKINVFSEQVLIKFDDAREVVYDFDMLEELELAYAITVHKSQGSEYPAVIIPMYSGPRLLMNKNLLYTAVTRAKKCVCLVGNEDVFHQMAENEAEQKRYSSLDIRIKELLFNE